MSAKLRRGDPGFARVVAAFFIGGFAIFELLYCVQPLLPEFARAFALGPATASLAVSVSTVVMAASLFFAGAAAERFGCKPVMVASLIVSALATLAAGLAPNWPALLALRGLIGLSLAGLPAVAMAYLAEEIDAPALGLSLYLFFYYVGSSLNGWLGGLAYHHAGWDGVAALICALLGLALLAALKLARVPPPRHLRS